MIELVVIRLDSLPAPHARAGCRDCGCELGYLARYIQIGGATAVRWVCNACELYGSTGDLPKALVASLGVHDLADLPVRVDRSHERSAKDLQQCASCESWEWETEEHHWAPQAIFPDWPYNLTVTLCKSCHNDWHTRMRDHGLRWPHETNVPPITVKRSTVEEKPRRYLDPEDIPF